MRFYYIVQGLLWSVVLIVMLLAMQGCAVTTAASVVSYAATGKGVGDHVASAATGGDCNVVKHTVNGQYVCEMPVVYNRSGF
jgi:hypothetical protein